MRIAIDAMGGDFAPREIVKGAVRAAGSVPGLTALYLVGKEDAIRHELAACGGGHPSIRIVPATEVVEMGEAPAAAIRRKKDSSISRAVDLVKQGEADAVFSAGNTGAAVAATTLKLRTLEGIARPAIAAIMPCDPPFVLVDAGATTDCSPQILYQFAIMGSIFARVMLKVDKPRVGLLSIGEEDAKGNEATKDAFQLLEKSRLNFVGNIEGHDFFEGQVDVVVSDGFVGNIVLKTSESVAHLVSRWLKQELTRNPLRMLGAWLCRGGLDAIRHRGDPAQYGGAPLLGVNGVCIIGHGVSSHVAVLNAIRVASEWVRNDINRQIIESVKAAI